MLITTLIISPSDPLLNPTLQIPQPTLSTRSSWNQCLPVLLQSIQAYSVQILLVLLAINLLHNKYGHGINHIPGPPLAAWTKLWHLHNVSKGQAHRTIIDLHKNYGKLVRLAPNVVDVSDPAMIQVIYNVKGDFKKVSHHQMIPRKFHLLIWNRRRHSTPWQSSTGTTSHR